VFVRITTRAEINDRPTRYTRSMPQAFATARTLGPFPLISLAVACAVAAGTYALGSRLGSDTHEAAAVVPALSLHGAAPGAGEFARLFAGMTNQMAAQQDDGARIRNVDCVQASKGHYMCSYGIVRPSQPVECHVVQAEWTPTEVDSFRVKMSGRVGRCGSLREALRSLG
jgi:hypothetical protein